MDWNVVATLIGGVNLVFLLKLLFSDVRELRKLILDHLFWHMEDPKYHPKRSTKLTDE